MSDYSPLIILHEDGTTSVATQEQHVALQAKHPVKYQQWLDKNRILMGKALMKNGLSHSTAWQQAFDKYPVAEEKRKPAKKSYFTL